MGPTLYEAEQATRDLQHTAAAYRWVFIVHGAAEIACTALMVGSFLTSAWMLGANGPRSISFAASFAFLAGSAAILWREPFKRASVVASLENQYGHMATRARGVVAGIRLSHPLSDDWAQLCLERAHADSNPPPRWARALATLSAP